MPRLRIHKMQLGGAVKFEAIRVNGIRSIDKFEAETLGSIVVVAGPNGCGKSSLLDAIRAFKASYATYVTDYAGPEGGRQTYSFSQVAPDFPSLVSMTAESAEIFATIRLSPKEREILGCGKEILEGGVRLSRDRPRNSEIILEKDGPALRSLFGQLRDGVGSVEHIPSDRRFTKEPMRTLDFSPSWEIKYRLKRVDQTTGKFDELKWDLYQLDYMDAKASQAGTTPHPNYIDGIRQIFSDFLDHKEFLGVEVVPGWRSPPRFAVKTPRGVHEIDELSSGEKEILMTYSLLQRLKLTNSVILFDEPELHLHNTLVRKVLRHIRGLATFGNQFWLSTQHPQIIRDVDLSAESLYYLPGGQEGENVAWLVTQEAQKTHVLEGLGVSIKTSAVGHAVDLDEALECGEGQFIEFVQHFPDQARELARDIAAFATSNLGNIFLGVRKDCTVTGLPNLETLTSQDELRRRIEGITRGTVNPAITVEVNFLKTSEGKCTCRILVPKGSEPVYYVNNVPYLRHGTESRPAQPHEVEELVVRHSKEGGPALIRSEDAR